MTKSIEISINIGCKVQCKFCPQDISMLNYATKNKLEQIKFSNLVKFIQNFSTSK